MRQLTPIVIILTALGYSLPSTAETITDTVLVGDREWAQVDLFTGLSGDTISRVCPAGNCAAGTGELLNNWDMSGWSWAGVDEVQQLFSTISPYTSDSPEFAAENSSWAPEFFDQLGFRPTMSSDSGRALLGRTSTAEDLYRDVTGGLSDYSDPAIGDAITTQHWTPHHYPYANIGAFFYRSSGD